MPWKMDGEHIVVQDGKPVWIEPDGKELPFDAEHSLNKIKELNSESAARRKELREAQERLKPFAEIDDPADWIERAHKALSTVKLQ